MNLLVRAICKIGIFMIAAQAVIHFAPEQKYAKYMKLVVGIIMLLQFLTPVYKLMGGEEADWSAQLSGLEAEWSSGLLIGEAAEVNSAAGGIIRNVEKEIKSKLNNVAAGEGYSVIKVDVDISNIDESGADYSNNNNDSYEKYELDRIRVVARRNAARVEAEGGYTENIDNSDDNKVIVIEKISVQKIDIEENSTKEQEANQANSGDKQEACRRLRESFCTALGIEEKYMEVIIYGEVE